MWSGWCWNVFCESPVFSFGEVVCFRVEKFSSTIVLEDGSDEGISWPSKSSVAERGWGMADDGLSDDSLVGLLSFPE